MEKNFKGNLVITSLEVILLVVAIVFTMVNKHAFFYETHIPSDAYYYLVAWLCAAFLFALVSLKEFVSGFLLCVLCMMIAWRIAAIYEIQIIITLCVITFLLLLSNFLFCVVMNLKHPEKYLHQISAEGWQLVFIRMYIGFDFIPHLTKKLFAGPIPYMADVNSFMYMGVPHADKLVMIAGICELLAAITISLGFFMRIGAIGAVIYLITSAYFRTHLSLSFAWAGPGGLEFAMMWIILILCFAVTGAHQFSIDQRLEDRFQLPVWMKRLM